MKTIINSLKSIYSGPFQATLVISFTLVSALTLAIGAWVIASTIDTYLVELMNDSITHDMELAESLYEIKLQQISDLTDQIALDPAVINHLGAANKGDPIALQIINDELRSKVTNINNNLFFALLRSDGEFLYSFIASSKEQLEPIPCDGNWYDLPIVNHSLSNEIQSTATEVIPVEFLEMINLEKKAFIELLFTERASENPFDPREGTAGLVLFSISPIHDNSGYLQGAAVAFHMLNNDFTLVDEIKEIVDIDTVTIFLGDLRVSTNVLNSEGERAIGTRVSEEVSDVVLTGGDEYLGTAFVVNQDYITRYQPLTDHTGEVVGILYVGERSSSFLSLVNTFDQRISLVAALAILLTFIIATPVSRLITRPLRELRELVLTSKKVIGGDLNARAPVMAGGEVGLVATSFNTMLDTLQTTQNQLVHKEKLASLGQLAAGVAHELNNPLATILLFSEAITRDKNKEIDNDLKMIVSETKRCKRIVGDLLNFARQQQVTLQPTDVHALLKDVISSATQRIQTASVSIITIYNEDLPIIQGDEQQLRQVFQNLMTNAIEAMPEGGTLTIRTRNILDGMIAIEIHDTGVGIPAGNQRKIFTPFFTTKPIGKGTGLGLAIAYGIVKMHRGQINVNSNIGEGTTFTIILPISLKIPNSEKNTFEADNTETNGSFIG